MKKLLKQFASVIMVFLISILPMFNIYASAATENKDSATDIVDIAIKDGRFKTLTKALQSADLADTLKTKGPFTVFAPTDDAFKKLPSGTLESLLKPENKETLKSILLYHVTEGSLSAEDLSKLNGKELTSLNGNKLKISVKNDEIFINNSKVIVSDIKGSNGIIHVIDAVLIPN